MCATKPMQIVLIWIEPMETLVRDPRTFCVLILIGCRAVRDVMSNLPLRANGILTPPPASHLMTIQILLRSEGRSEKAQFHSYTPTSQVIVTFTVTRIIWFPKLAIDDFLSFSPSPPTGSTKADLLVMDKAPKIWGLFYFCPVTFDTKGETSPSKVQMENLALTAVQRWLL